MQKSFEVASTSTFTIPKKNRSLRDILSKPVDVEDTSPMKSSFSRGNRDTLSMLAHVLKYDGGDSDDDLFMIALSFTYPI